MAIAEVKVPQLSESVAEATMLTWKKKVGDSVAADEILIEIETDKVVLEVPAPSAVLCFPLGSKIQTIRNLKSQNKFTARPALLSTDCCSCKDDKILNSLIRFI